MKWKNRLTNYNFWISLVSAALLIIQAFDFKLDIGNINEIATAVLGLLVVIGIISDPTKTYSKLEENKTNKNSVDEKPNKQIEKQEVEIKENEENLKNLPNENQIENNDSDFQNNFKVFIDKLCSVLDFKSTFPSVEGKEESKDKTKDDFQENDKIVEKETLETENNLNLEEKIEANENLDVKISNENLENGEQNQNLEAKNEEKENPICYSIVN